MLYHWYAGTLSRVIDPAVVPICDIFSVRFIREMRSAHMNKLLVGDIISVRTFNSVGHIQGCVTEIRET